MGNQKTLSHASHEGGRQAGLFGSFSFHWSSSQYCKREGTLSQSADLGERTERFQFLGLLKEVDLRQRRRAIFMQRKRLRMFDGKVETFGRFILKDRLIVSSKVPQSW